MGYFIAFLALALWVSLALNVILYLRAHHAQHLCDEYRQMCLDAESIVFQQNRQAFVEYIDKLGVQC